jgi:ABC-2 type transport system permease protein
MFAPVRRIGAILNKEFIQIVRDRLTFAIMLVLPILQLVLFGFAINSDPRHLPTVLYLEDDSAIVRSLASGLQNSSYFDIRERVTSAEAATKKLQNGEAAFVITVPAGFTRDMLRGDRPQLLIEADASDPSAASNAVGMIQMIVQSSLKRDLTGQWASLAQGPMPVDIVIHRKYNPEGISQYNIVPGLLGVILTMTMVMITSIAMTRETERGNMENLLAMPARPWEVMAGKIAPYVVVGVVQTLIVLLAAHYVFHVPFIGSLWLLSLGVGLFIIANLAVGFTFSTVARTQMQAMQMTFFFFLPSIMLSGFMFPFRGMPEWAQAIGQVFPLTHFLRIVRGVMLKGADWAAMWPSIWPILVFIAAATTIAMMRYRSTLD